MNRTDVYWLPASELNRVRLNSDRGGQYTGGDVADKCQESGLRQSVGRTACVGIMVCHEHIRRRQRELILILVWCCVGDGGGPSTVVLQEMAVNHRELLR